MKLVVKKLLVEKLELVVKRPAVQKLVDNGIRHVSNKVRPINSPADLKGLKVRTPPDPVTIDIMQALGADAVQIMRDIKSVLDPKWLLNQNKMFPTGAGAMESFLLALPTLEGLTPG